MRSINLSGSSAQGQVAADGSPLRILAQNVHEEGEGPYTGEICATIEIKIGYFKPVFEGTLVCEATVLNKGKSVASLEAVIRNGEQLVSKASGTFSIFRRKTDAQCQRGNGRERDFRTHQFLPIGRNF